MLYSCLHSTLWTDEKLVVNPDYDEKAVFCYLISSPHHNILGLYYLPMMYAIHDMSATEEQFNKGFTKLLDKGLIKYDSNSSMVFIKNFIKHNPIQNPNQIKSALSKLREMPYSPLFNDLHEEITLIYKPFHKPLMELLCERLQKPLPERLPTNTNTNTNTEAKAEHTVVSGCSENVQNKKRTMIQELDRLMPGRITPKIQQELDYLIQDHGECKVNESIQLMLEMKEPPSSPMGYLRGILKNKNGQAKTVKPIINKFNMKSLKIDDKIIWFPLDGDALRVSDWKLQKRMALEYAEQHPECVEVVQ